MKRKDKPWTEERYRETDDVSPKAMDKLISQIGECLSSADPTAYHLEKYSDKDSLNPYQSLLDEAKEKLVFASWFIGGVATAGMFGKVIESFVFTAEHVPGLIK